MLPNLPAAARAALAAVALLLVPLGAQAAVAAAPRAALQARYAAMLAESRAALAARLPELDGRQREAFLAAYAAEAAASPKPDAYAALVQLQTQTLAAAAPLLAGLEAFLGSEGLDGHLLRGAVLANATPQRLAEFAAAGAPQRELVEQLLGDAAAMREMLVAGGAKGGNYPRALEILAAIRQASPRARDGGSVLGRLALGTALEHAVAVKGDQEVEPVQRYLAYEQAYLAGELDPAFPGFSAFDYRFVTNDPFSDAEIAWLRTMLRNYRPDAILEPDYRWRYVTIVRTDVTYKTPEWGAVPGSKAAQLINGGGKCGPRAWFGRLALRAFGIPTWGVRQTGHAALAHWTPRGWTTNFGAAWQFNWWEDRGGPDFLLETQARGHAAGFLRALRAEWLGDVLGEPKADGRRAGRGGFWAALAVNQRRALAAQPAPAPAPAAGPAAGPRPIAAALQAAPVAEADQVVAIAAEGAIVIPAVACTASRDSAKKLVRTRSFAGGMQLHVERLTEPIEFEYRVEVPAAGRYALTAQVVTVHKDQRLAVAVGGAAEPTAIALPYTAGAWQAAAGPVLELPAGAAVLRCSIRGPHQGVTIKELRLAPVR